MCCSFCFNTCSAIFWSSIQPSPHRLTFESNDVFAISRVRQCACEYCAMCSTCKNIRCYQCIGIPIGFPLEPEPPTTHSLSHIHTQTHSCELLTENLNIRNTRTTFSSDLCYYYVHNTVHRIVCGVYTTTSKTHTFYGIWFCRPSTHVPFCLYIHNTGKNHNIFWRATDKQISDSATAAVAPSWNSLGIVPLGLFFGWFFRIVFLWERRTSDTNYLVCQLSWIIFILSLLLLCDSQIGQFG